MSLARRISRGLSRRSALNELRIRNVRFRKLLENLRAILDLMDDGKEKLEGGYIFDRQYVVSLVDKLIGRLGQLVFDACVLAPLSKKELFTTYDRYRERSLVFLRPESKAEAGAAVSDSGDEEPEVVLLSEAVDWFLVDRSREAPSVMDFLRLIFDRAVEGLDPFKAPPVSMRGLDIGPLAAGHRVDLCELTAADGVSAHGSVSVADIQCSPLAALLMGALQEAEQPAASAVQTPWVAVADYQHLSLRCLESGRSLLVESSLSGHTDADYVLVYTIDPHLPTDLLPAGFHLEKTDLGTMAWSYGLHGSDIEESLVGLGQRLFGSEGKAQSEPSPD